MTPQWHHKWRHVKNTKITKNRQNHSFLLLFQAKVAFFGNDVCQRQVCLHMFLLQINQINKIKHSESVSWKKKQKQKQKQKHDLCVISIENQLLVSFSLDPALYYATLRHNPRSVFFLNGLKSSASLEEKNVMQFQREKITTGWDITTNVGGGRIPPPDPCRVNFMGIFHVWRE